MKEAELKTFVEGVVRYFSTVTATPATVGIPYVKSANHPIEEVTGIIGLTGNRRGGIFITCPRKMISEIVTEYLGVADPDLTAIKDLAGELANTVAGNASLAFGSDFQISVPVVLVGKPEQMDLPASVPTFIIPIEWKSYKAYLAVGVE
jgi:chemotaxis protein CheX